MTTSIVTERIMNSQIWALYKKIGETEESPQNSFLEVSCIQYGEGNTKIYSYPQLCLAWRFLRYCLDTLAGKGSGIFQLYLRFLTFFVQVPQRDFVPCYFYGSSIAGIIALWSSFCSQYRMVALFFPGNSVKRMLSCRRLRHRSSSTHYGRFW